MSRRYAVFSSISEPFLASIALVLQIIALCTSWWATFSARTELGKAEENGHYGLWTLCSTKAPHWKEDCDPLDTFFEAPPYTIVSAVLGGFHLILLGAFIPLALLRTLQVVKNTDNSDIKSKILRIIKASMVLCCVFLAILVATFVCIGEYDKKEYLIIKGWSFWTQVFIIFLDFVILSLCVTECIQFFRQERLKHIDPDGKRAETYGNPSFDADSPEMPRSQQNAHGAIAFTESSGNPYGLNHTSDKNFKDPYTGENTEKNFQTLTFENECYLESSPKIERRH